jgi:BirA family transcriptional regulator, biotin operon repressor / biotin---[acetyl-CoA-carboxylase] ligase
MHVLEILKPNEFVSGEEIARLLKISRAGVHKQIQKLRNIGYGITGTNNSGYILLSRPDLVTPEELKYYLDKNGVSRHNIVYFPVAASTQDEAKNIAEKDIKLPAIVIAERQTGSYGRRRRQWASPEGGLWFSLVLKPDIPPERISQITFVASLAVCRAVETVFWLSPLIKWPNDVTLNGKKFSGILTEISAEVGKLNWVVIGIGINVNNVIPPKLKHIAVSLSMVAGEKINRAEFLAAVLSEFYGLYDVFIKKGFAGLQKEYNKKSLLNGANVKIDNGDSVIEGKAYKIDTEGYLWIRTAEKKLLKVIAGDIIMVKKNGHK